MIVSEENVNINKEKYWGMELFFVKTECIDV